MTRGDTTTIREREVGAIVELGLSGREREREYYEVEDHYRYQ